MPRMFCCLPLVTGLRCADEASEDATASETGREVDPLENPLSVGEAVEMLGTTARFPRRLAAERRIRIVHVGRHVCIPTSALKAFVASGTVAPDEFSWSPRGGVA